MHVLPLPGSLPLHARNFLTGSVVLLASHACFVIVQVPFSGVVPFHAPPKSSSHDVLVTCLSEDAIVGLSGHLSICLNAAARSTEVQLPMILVAGLDLHTQASFLIAFNSALVGKP